jgi:iron complex outermembrane receptor protein
MPYPAPGVRSARRICSTALVASFLLGSAAIQAATISGTVLNKGTQKYLERAVVEVPGTSFRTVTASDGTFRLTGLPAGTHTVVADYAGLERVTQTITVGADESASASFELTSDVYELNKYTVTSTLEGNAYAIQQQRRAESARSVTSIDAFLNQSTGNPGEFLRNLSGIQMDYSQNEPNRIRIRGQDSTLTSVTMDGNEIASAASTSTNRQLEVDQLSMAALSSVEVYKAPIPSMSANAIGGAVNLVTKSAFDQKGQRAGLQLGVLTDSNDFFTKYVSPGHNEVGQQRSLYPVGRFTYSNSFFNNRLGVLFTVGRDDSNMNGSSSSGGLNIFNGPAAPTAFTRQNSTILRNGPSFAPNRQLRTRTDYALNTDFRLTDEIEVFLKTSFSKYHSTNRNHAVAFRPANVLASYTPGSTLENYGTTAGTASQSVSVFDKYTDSWQINPGLRFKSDEWKIDLVGAFSKSINHYRNPNNFAGLTIATDANLGIQFVDSPANIDTPSAITQNAGADMYLLNSYRPNNQGAVQTEGQRSNHAGFVSNNVRDSSEVRYSGRLDVQRDFRLGFPFYLKAGLAYNETIRDKRQPQRRWYWAGNDGVIGTTDDTTAAGANLGRFAEPIAITMQIPGFPLREPEYLSTVKLFEYWQANPQVLVENLAYAEEQKFLGRQKVNEKITGYYLMGNATFGKLNVLAGLRVEETDVVAQGSRTLPTSGPNNVLPAGVNANSLEGVRAKLRFQTTATSYRSDPFPYLHLRYEATHSLQFRTSYTESIGRPNFAQILPAMTQDDTPVGGFDGTITSNRVGLLPQRSKNYDVGADYYTKTAGVWSAAWFMRDVADYISTATIAMTPELLAELNLTAQFSNYRVATSQNLGNAKWSGYELGVRQRLGDWSFVPGVLQGLEVWANYTGIYQMEGQFTGGAAGATITHLSGVVDSQYNAGVSYRTPRGKFYAQLKTNFQKRRPTANILATGPSNQRDPYQEDYQFWDLETSYRVNPKLRLTVTALNLTSERATTSEVGIIIGRQQATGIQWLFAANYDF